MARTKSRDQQSEERSRFAVWSELAQATNATATATHLAEAGKRHIVLGATFILYSGVLPTVPVRGGVVSGAVDIRDSVALNLYQPTVSLQYPKGLDLSGPNVAVSAYIGAGGASVIGVVSIFGISVPDEASQ